LQGSEFYKFLQLHDKIKPGTDDSESLFYLRTMQSHSTFSRKIGKGTAKVYEAERTGVKFATKLQCRNSHLAVTERTKFAIRIGLLNPEITQQMGFSVVKKAQIEAGDGLRTVMDAR
jgi:hypothetical protein